MGHEPDLGQLAAWLIGARAPLTFRKGGVARIDIDVEALPAQRAGLAQVCTRGRVVGLPPTAKIHYSNFMSWIDQRPDDAMAGAFEAIGPEAAAAVDQAHKGQGMSVSTLKETK